MTHSTHKIHSLYSPYVPDTVQGFEDSKCRKERQVSFFHENNLKMIRKHKKIQLCINSLNKMKWMTRWRVVEMTLEAF
jgi:hypothetical protein